MAMETTTTRGASSILDRIGGDAMLEAAVGEFYFRLVCDELVLPFFAGVDLEGLKRHQRRFLTLAFTNQVPADVCAMLVKAHARLFAEGLSEMHFDLVVGHLVETLYSLGIDESLVNDIVTIVAPFRAIFQENALTKKEKTARKPVKIENQKSSVDLGRDLCTTGSNTTDGNTPIHETVRPSTCSGRFGRLWRTLSCRSMENVM